jgi:5-methylcytosine-specific restriction endonuclease McrA
MRTQYGTKDCPEKVFERAKEIRGKDPELYRQDPYGNVMYRHSYGKDTNMGWNLDHIKPASRGGSNDIVNLQALNSHTNKSKGNTLVKKSRHNQ